NRRRIHSRNPPGEVDLPSSGDIQGGMRSLSTFVFSADGAASLAARGKYLFSVGKFSLVLSRSDSGRNSGILPDVSRRFLTCAGTRTKCPRHESGSMPELRVINSSTHTLPRAESAIHSNAVCVIVLPVWRSQ